MVENKPRESFRDSESDPGFLVAKGKFDGQEPERKVAEKT
ncbi:hypothetical protein LCGC14_2233270, partial [marine sediment metagenome]